MDIDTAWDIIERVLHDRLPEVASTLRGPVSDDDLERLAGTVGQQLPADFVASLRRHDGQDNPTALLDLFDHFTLLSAPAMIETSDMRVSALGDDVDDVIGWMLPERVRPIMNCRGWVQFTAAESQGYALDLDPLPAGERGQVIFLPVDGPTPAPEFPSYGAWLSSLAEKLDAGAFTIDDTLGLWLDA
ncbi:SMI1/KNR4 family protein [Agrococcus sp. ARC_14]|uniref:SMI1/KNR4 family protein n=1 Tax=Agrococcus sp. ARC_14 TaxID=2919927 RepID=UPI001F05DFA2|nr:SMI1/KNR4 family protein [Agrococcus sp. ARC_14]